MNSRFGKQNNKEVSQPPFLFVRFFALLNQTPIAQFGYCFNQRQLKGQLLEKIEL